MKRLSILTGVLVLLMGCLNAQVLRTDPAFPSQFDDVTVYFEAKEGDMGLAGFEGDVYAHTGVITSTSSSPTDWKYVQGDWGVAFPKTLMTSEGDDLYSISFNIKEFYGIPDGELVEKLAFVFRSEDGNVTGRASGGGDLFTDVFPPDEGLLVSVFSPSDQNEIIYEDDSLLIEFALNQAAHVSIFDNDALIYEDSTEQTAFFIKNADLGEHELSFVISLDQDTITLSRTYFVLERVEILVDPTDLWPNGLTYHTDSTYVFQLFAPLKEHVFLLTPANEYKVDLSYRLNKSLDESTYWIELPRDLFSEGRNTYQYLIDGELRIADPYSTVVLDPFNDQFVPDDVLAELPDYPEDLTTDIVTAFDENQEEFPWTDFEGYTIPDESKLVIYELLMRDFLDDKNYKSLIDTLDYLEGLGVNAIELMPVNEFEGNQSWGYNPSFHMALDKYYGSRRQLKRVVDEAHSRGIAVILDVVYNHVFSQSPLAQMYWDASNFRPAENNPFLNVTARHPFNVGYDVNHESEATKRWVKQTLGYWMGQFHIDGFRFDLSKGFTQTNSGNNADMMAQYDASRVAILKDYADYVWSVNPDAYVILEHFAYNEEETELANYGMMLWANMHFEFTKAVKEQNSELRWLDYQERGWNEPHAVGYMESHDEERLMVELLNSGFSLERALERIETASAIFYLVPGPKMFWQFGELGFDYSINWCTNGTVNGCRLDPKPVVWDYLENEERSELKDVMSNIINLKTNYPTFCTRDYDFDDRNFDLKVLRLNHEEMDAVVMVNFRDREGSVIPKFQSTGTWYEYFTGDSIQVEDVEARIELISGEYRIYTSERITPINGFTTSVNNIPIGDVSIFPNPVVRGQRVNLSDEKVTRIEVLDALGRRIMIIDDQSSFNVSSDWSSGVYHLNILTSDGQHVQRLVVK